MDVSQLGSRPSNMARHTDLARENHRLLDGCPNHEFKQVEEAPRLVMNYRCKNCSGVIDWIAYRWYVTGRRHEQEAQRADGQRTAG